MIANILKWDWVYQAKWKLIGSLAVGLKTDFFLVYSILIPAIDFSLFFLKARPDIFSLDSNSIRYLTLKKNVCFMLSEMCTLEKNWKNMNTTLLSCKQNMENNFISFIFIDRFCKFPFLQQVNNRIHCTIKKYV